MEKKGSNIDGRKKRIREREKVEGKRERKKEWIL
jgi:hypothetical protein